MNKERIVEILNEDLSFELAATIQYLWHHYMAEGMESPAIIDEFEETSRDEMKHIEVLAQRIIYLGGQPTTRMAPVKKGGSLKKMISDDLEAENGAIERYRRHIKIMDSEGDPTSRLMLEQILTVEEKHADTWETVLALRKK
ncbi:MAG: ferritin-like domain-containing protein [Chloroflexota bacterium]|mgnify:CR=1 FL=1